MILHQVLFIDAALEWFSFSVCTTVPRTAFTNTDQLTSFYKVLLAANAQILLRLL